MSKAKFWRRSLPLIAIIGVTLIIMLPQMLMRSTIIGSDAIFHFNRFYDAAKQLRHLNFSYFQTNYGFQQSGRIINALYGPYFAYLNGILLMFVRSWHHFQLLSTFMIYLIGGWGMYLLARKVRADRPVALSCALLFMNIGWMPRWGLSQNLNAWGAALAPFVLICALRMLTDKQNPVEILPLALIMAVIIEVHILSTLIFTAVLLPFFIIGLVQTKQKLKMLRHTVAAALLAVLLTANIWGSFLTIFANNSIAEPAQFDLEQHALQFSVLLGQRNQLGIVCLLLFSAQFLYVLFGRTSQINRIVTWIGSIILFISSDLFPWATLQHYLPVLQSLLQFPVRFTIIAYPLLLCGVALSATQLKLFTTARKSWVHPVAFSAVFLCLVPNVVGIYNKSAVYQSVDVLNSWTGVTVLADSPEQIRHSLRARHPGKLLGLVEKRHPDYLPIPDEFSKLNFHRSKEYEEQVIAIHHQFDHQVLPGGRLRLSWFANTKTKRQLPLITYKESQLRLNGQRLSRQQYQITRIGAPIVMQQPGRNHLILRFKQPALFTYLLVISLVSWALLALLGVVKLIDRCLNGNLSKRLIKH